MEPAIAIVESVRGIFVCADNDRPVWSKLDARSHDCVVTFPDEPSARQYLGRLRLADPAHRYRFVTVYPDHEDGYASSRALIRAGLFFELGTLAFGVPGADELPAHLLIDPAQPPDPDSRSDRS